MVDQIEFFRIADEILAEGRQPSQRLIRERLAKGGSFSDLGRLYVEWATEKGVKLRPTREDVPKHLLDRVAAAATEIWGDGRRNGVLTAQNERERLVKERDALRVALAEASARADALEDMMGLRPEAGDEAQMGMQKAPEASDEGASFWDRLMQEAHDLLGDRTLAAKAIIAELRDNTKREAADRDGAWGPTRLNHKIRKSKKGRELFDEADDGFCRRGGATVSGSAASEAAA